jgi:hypothetical protein
VARDTGDAAHLAQRLAAYVEAGAQHLVLRVGLLDIGDQPERIADGVRRVRHRLTA